MKYIFMLLLLSGCTNPLRTEMKCVNGIVYTKNDGAWIQALYYKDNKCLPEEKADRE